ncbi:methylmalonyl-CoA mutase family protein [Rhodanobacter aciditrophus]|uniref:Methylmalonyl-CoA mutase family protein n=1 Tax=Rhodanobacter aciditrophus TaxID=1623218 RepID=A0ABW4B4L0_9GAMM
MSSVRAKGIYKSLPNLAKSWQSSEAGQAPFVRGPYRTMYQQKPWTMRQYAGFSSADATNEFFKKQLENGQTGLSVAFDLPTHLGLDSTDERAQYDVGKTGVAIDSVEDMKRLFDGIDLSSVSVSMTMNGAIMPILACYIVAAEEAGYASSSLRGTIQNDILKEFAVRNTFIHAPKPSLEMSIDVVEFSQKKLPNFNTMSISGYHFQEGGATPELELALTLAHAKVYLLACQKRGLDLNTIARRLSFFFASGMAFFKEIAKLRAARKLWHDLLVELGVTDEQALRMKMHCQTSGVSLNAESPYDNLTRTTVEAMAAVMGGTQSLHTNSFDEAIALPSDFAASLALGTQQILQQETGLIDVVDPWGGSYMMETLTSEMIDYVNSTLISLESGEGVLAKVEQGDIAFFIHQQAMQQAQLSKPFVTSISDQQDKPQVSPRVIHSEKALESQRLSINKLKLVRNNRLVNQSLEKLKEKALSGQNLMPYVVAAIKHRATVGEVTEALCQIHPRFFPQQKISNELLDSEDLKTVRSRYQQFMNKNGRALKVLFTKVGLDGHDRGAKQVVATLKAVGLDVTYLPVLTPFSEVQSMIQNHHFDVVGISSLAGAHLDFSKAVFSCIDPVKTALIVGGVIPDHDFESLEKIGIEGIFTRHSEIGLVVNRIIELVEAK